MGKNTENIWHTRALPVTMQCVTGYTTRTISLPWLFRNSFLKKSGGWLRSRQLDAVEVEVRTFCWLQAAIGRATPGRNARL